MDNFDLLADFVAENPTPELDRNARDILAVKMKQEVENWSVAHYADDFRWHLGASIIGGPCDRSIWYTFRWATKDSRDGRTKRLHARGHLEEAKINETLRGIGCTVYDVDPNTGKQFRMSYHHGHFGGSSDGILLLPKHWGIPGVFQPEYKTSKTGAPFNNLIKEGVEIFKEQHFVQQSLYGNFHGVKLGIYIAVNKNDDDTYYEFTELSKTKAEGAIRRAENIIITDYAPSRISEKETYFTCRMCDHHAVCHLGASMAVNCRSCVHASPVAGANWHCGYHGQDIPRDYVPKACPKYQAIA